VPRERVCDHELLVSAGVAKVVDRETPAPSCEGNRVARGGVLGVMTIKRLAVTLTGLTLTLLLGAALNDRTAHARETQTVLRAQSIELVDGSGRVRAQLDVSPDGEVVFRLRDAKGTIRVKLAASEAGSGLLLANERTEPGVHILAQRTQTSVLLQRGAKRRVLRP
jgi:hypothetical protein